MTDMCERQQRVLVLVGKKHDEQQQQQQQQRGEMRKFTKRRNFGINKLVQVAVQTVIVI